jgi:predicted nuclease of predicted toxin-antitoxin system
VKFLVDNQLPPALALLIRQDFGVDALHVSDIGMRNTTDQELWAYASEHEYVLISKDEDFVRLALTAPTARLVWVRVGNCRREFLPDVFRRTWRKIAERLQEHERFIEIR